MHETERACPLWRRLMAVLYDLVAVVAILMLAAALALLFGLGKQTAGKDLGYTLYLLAAWFLYLGWCWTRGGMTLGMRAWRIRISAMEGGLPGWPASLVRFLVSMLSAACLGLGFAWCLVDRDKRSWHDMASRTRLTWQPRKRASDGASQDQQGGQGQ